MPDTGQQWELFGYDMRHLVRDWSLAWRDLLQDHDSPVRRRLDEVVTLTGEDGQSCFQAGEETEFSEAFCRAILLPEDLVLAKTLQFPLAAVADLESALQLEVTSSSPFNVSDTGFGWRILNRDASQVTVALVIVSMSVVMSYLGRQYNCHDATESEVWAEVEGRKIVICGFGEGKRESRYFRRLAKVSGMLVIAALTLLLIVGSSTLFKGAELRKTQVLSTTAEREGEAVAAMRDSLALGNDIIDAVNGQQNSHPDPQAELARLSLLLRDDAFIERFTLRGNEIELRGRGKDAAAVLQELTEQAGYAQVASTRPITLVGNSGMEQFHLRIILKKEDAG